MEVNEPPIIIYAERDCYGGFVVDIEHKNNSGMIKAFEVVMNEKPKPFILGDGVRWVRSTSYNDSKTVRVEYQFDTERENLHKWSYETMLLIFGWYCCRALDHFKGGVVGEITSLYWPTRPEDGPNYYAWCLSAPLRL